MPNNIDDALTALTETVTRQKTVLDSATAMIEGLPALIEAAKEEGRASGMSPGQLEIFNTLKTAIETETAELEAALTANTPTPPNP